MGRFGSYLDAIDKGEEGWVPGGVKVASQGLPTGEGWGYEESGVLVRHYDNGNFM